MKKDVDNFCKKITYIIKQEEITQDAFAKRIGKTKQFIWAILNGKRNITEQVKQKIIETFPKYFDESNLVELALCTDISLPSKSLLSASTETVYFDRRFLNVNNSININVEHCKIVSVGSDLMFPAFKRNDRVVIDESCSEFINGQVFAFVAGHNCYVRQISILPDGIVKCISFNDKEDTFYLEDLKDVKILGLIIPNIRL